jgi:hypothetical protein
MAQAQRRGGEDATIIFAPLLETRCIPSAAKPLSPAAGVGHFFSPIAIGYIFSSQ